MRPIAKPSGRPGAGWSRRSSTSWTARRRRSARRPKMRRARAPWSWRAGWPPGRSGCRRRSRRSCRPAGPSWPRSRGSAAGGTSPRPRSATCMNGPRCCSIGSWWSSPPRGQVGGGEGENCSPTRAAAGFQCAELRVRRLPVRPVARATASLPADLGPRDALVRALGGHGVPGRLRRLERAPVPPLVPDRRRLGRGVAGPGYGLPAGQDALRLRLRVLARPGRPLHLPHLAQVRLPRQRCRTLPLRGRGARDGGRHRGARGPRGRGAGGAAPGGVGPPATHTPPGALFPGYLRLLTPFFNITGAFSLTLGALYSAYVFMPKRRVIRYSLAGRRGPALMAMLVGAVLAAPVTFAPTRPAPALALVRGRLHSRVPAT